MEKPTATSLETSKGLDKELAKSPALNGIEDAHDKEGACSNAGGSPKFIEYATPKPALPPITAMDILMLLVVVAVLVVTS